MIAGLMELWSARLRRDGHVEELQLKAFSIANEGQRLTPHAVFSLRNCSRCGGLHRAAPEPTRVHCSAWTGIVRRLELTDAPSAGAYRATATWNPPLAVPGTRPGLTRQFSYGRGLTERDAEQGCVGEALERYCLIYRGDETLIRARYEDIDAIHPDDIQLFSDAQYANRRDWNASADEDFWVPEPFQAGVPVDWLETRTLGSEKRLRVIPAACCLMWYQFRPGEPEFARADTIGCGAGPTFDHALTHALLEWVERDAMAIWWDNRLSRPGFRLDSFDCPHLQTVVEGLRGIGRDLFLLDCTTDIDIPAYVAVAPRFDGTEPLFAGAADLSPRTAACKAASEVGQVWYEAKRSGGVSESLRPWLLRETTDTQPYLMPCRLRDAPSAAPSRTPAAARETVVERLEAVGLTAYSVDHSREDVALHTVRAIVPGLRHIWNRRAPGRLYDIPVRLGWLQRAKDEAEMNPIPCMI